MRFQNLALYGTALLLSIGVRNVYAADPAKVKQAMDITAKGLCISDINEPDYKRCVRKVTVRDEGHPEGLLELIGATDLKKGKSSFYIFRVAYNPNTKKYFILELRDGNAGEGLGANGSLDEVFAAASDNKEGPHKIFRVLLNDPKSLAIHERYFSESLDQFIAKSKEKP